MTIEDVKKFKEYFYKKIADFDESLKKKNWTTSCRIIK